MHNTKQPKSMNRQQLHDWLLTPIPQPTACPWEPEDDEQLPPTRTEGDDDDDE